MWRTIYLTKLPGLDKKVRVAFDWTLDLLFPKDVCAVHEFPYRRDFPRREHAKDTVGGNGQCQGREHFARREVEYLQHGRA